MALVSSSSMNSLATMGLVGEPVDAPAHVACLGRRNRYFETEFQQLVK